MKIGQFLGERIGFKVSAASLAALDALAGQTFGWAEFHADLDECASHIEASTPIYVLPIGSEAGEDIGIHLRPEDVRGSRLAIVKMMPEGGATEIATSIEAFAFRHLATCEQDVNEGSPPDRLESALAMAERLFGKGFYQPGKYG